MHGTLVDPSKDLLRIPIENKVSFGKTTFFCTSNKHRLDLLLGTVCNKAHTKI